MKMSFAFILIANTWHLTAGLIENEEKRASERDCGCAPVLAQVTNKSAKTEQSNLKTESAPLLHWELGVDILCFLAC